MINFSKHKNTILPETPLQYHTEDVIKYMSIHGRTRKLDKDILMCEYIAFLDEYENGRNDFTPFTYKIYLHLMGKIFLKSYYNNLHQKVVTNER